MKFIKKLSFFLILLVILIGASACKEPIAKVKVEFTDASGILYEYVIESGSGIDEVPTVPKRDGYIGDWNVDDFSQFHKDTTITAIYTKNFFTVTFRDGSLIMRKSNVIIGENVSSLPNIPEREGFTSEWAITDFRSLTVDTVVNVIYTPIRLKLTFKSDGNEDIIRYVDYASDLIDIPDVPEKEGFSGIWDKEDFLQIKKDYTINAEYSPKQITINYIDADEDTENIKVVEYAEILSFPSHQNKEGFIFNGWYFDNEYNIRATEIVLRDNIDIFAQWVEINNDIATNPEFFTYFELSNGSYEISFDGDSEELPLEIILPNSYNGKLISKIANNAFMQVNIEEITIPTGVVEIGEKAFFQCARLKKVHFAPYNKLRVIGAYAFSESNVNNLMLARDIEKIDDFAFYGCNSLKLLNIPLNSQLKTIGDSAFEETQINNINVSENILSIGDFAFSNLKNCNINFLGLNNLMSIGRFAFKNCNGLEFFNAPNIISIGQGAFAGCKNLKELTILGDIPIVDYFDDDSFDSSYKVEQLCPNRNEMGEFVIDSNGGYQIRNISARLPMGLATIRIKNGVVDIVDYLLNNCGAVVNIYIPNSVKTIGKLSFAIEKEENILAMRKGIFSIAPDSQLELIKEQAFYARTSFDAIIFPAKLREIRQKAFLNTSLEVIEFINKDNLEFIGRDAFLNTTWLDAQTGIICLGDIAIGYKSDKVDLVVGSNIKAIAPYAFYDSGITILTISSTVKQINEYAFANCKQLVKLQINEGVINIDDYAFMNCDNLITIYLPKGIQQIGKGIFSGCSSVKEMSIYGNIILGHYFGLEEFANTYLARQIQSLCDEYEEEYDFYIPMSLKEVVLINDSEADDREIAPYAFMNISSMEKITFAEDIQRIAQCAFMNCTALGRHNDFDELIELPLSLIEIAESAFENTISLKKINSSSLIRLELIGDGAFKDSGLINFMVLSNIRIIGIEAFAGASSMETLSFENTIVTYNNQNEISNYLEIKDNAFAHCVGLIELLFPDRLTILGDYAFYGNIKINRINFGEESCFTKLGNYTFAECFALTEIMFPKGISFFEVIAPLARSNNIGTIGLRCDDTAQPVGSLFGTEPYSGGYQAIQNGTSYCIPNNLSKIIFNGGIVTEYFCQNIVSLKAVELLDVTAIGSNAFDNCQQIEKATLPNTLESIGKYAFNDCFSISLVDIPQDSSLEIIGEYAFGNNVSLQQFVLPLNITTVERYTFYGCTSLLDVDISEITQIQEYAFFGCLMLEQLDFCEYIEYVGEYAFYDCKNAIVPYKEFKYLLYIGDFAFYNCLGWKYLRVDNIESIGKSAFNGAYNLQEVTIPSLVLGEIFGSNIYENSYEINIGEKVYYIPLALNRVFIAVNVELLPDYAFAECVSIKDIIFLGDIPPQLGESVFENISSKLNLFVADEVKGQYKNMYDSYKERIYSYPMSVDCFEFVFDSVTNTYILSAFVAPLGNVVHIPSFYQGKAVVGIAHNVFRNNIEIEEIIIPNTIISIGEYAFAECGNLVRVIFEPSSQLSLISKGAFLGCDKLTSIVIPKSVRDLGEFVFAGTRYLEDNKYSYANQLSYVEFEEGSQLTNIGDYAFFSCQQLTHIALPDSVLWIGEGAFRESGLISISLPKFIEQLSKELFYECFDLVEIIIPNNVLEIRKNAFYCCISLVNVQFSEQLEIIQERAFLGCNLLEDLIFPYNIKRIESKAFAYCSSLEEVSLPNTIEYVADDAFPFIV